jgi:cytosine deaminase
VGEGIGLRAIEALVEVKATLRDLLELQVVALVSTPTAGLAGASNRALLKEALQAGADVGGGCPHLDPDRFGCLEACMQAAADAGVPLDLHTDETLDPTVLDLRDLVALARSSGFPGRVTASHCVSLGMQDEAVQLAVAEEIAGAGVAVVTLPQTNLFLQGRTWTTATPRGLTAVRPLLAAGAVVAAGADNLQDPFNTVGRADPLETAALCVMAAHLTPEEAYAAVALAPREALGLPHARSLTVDVGDPSELLAMRAATVREAVASAPSDRVVIHAGRIVARTESRCEL